jgi:hypothetical protein
LRERLSIGDDFIEDILTRGVVLYEREDNWGMDRKRDSGKFKEVYFVIKFILILYHYQ